MERAGTPLDVTESVSNHAGRPILRDAFQPASADWNAPQSLTEN